MINLQDSNEPVAWYHVPYPNSGISPMVSLRQQHEPSMYGAVVPLYIAPPQRKPRHISYVCPQCHWSLDERKPLTDEEIRDLWSWAMTAEAERTATTQQHAFARAIERAHSIGDNT